jgi:hypothetical protein
MTARVARAIQKRRCDRRSGNFFPQKRFLLVHGAAVGERTESERREDENDRARVPIIERAKCICRLGVSSARGVFANVRTLRNFVLLLKGETLELKSRAKKVALSVCLDDSLSRISSFS